MTYLPATADWSRSPYRKAGDHLQEAQRLLAQAQKLNLDAGLWEKRWTELRDRYLEAANDFHGNPGPAQERMTEISLKAEQFRSELGGAVENARGRQVQSTAVLPFAVGLLATVGTGAVFARRKANHTRNSSQGLP